MRLFFCLDKSGQNFPGWTKTSENSASFVISAASASPDIHFPYTVAVISGECPGWFATKLMEFGTRLAADHRLHPRDSMTMEMLSAELDGERLSDREFGRFFNNLIVGGIETTRNTLAWAMYEFIRHPDQYALLQANLDLVPNAVEEILRYRNTVVYLRRTATRDMEFAGASLRKGDKLICVLGSPNRDPALFDQPDTFDITRKPEHTRRNYRTFGAGPHFCIGVHQARLNLCSMLDEIARRINQPRMSSEPHLARSIFMDGFKSMPITFQRRE